LTSPSAHFIIHHTSNTLIESLNNKDANLYKHSGKRRSDGDDDDIIEESPRAKSIDITIRPDEEDKGRKISELERKNMKKRFLNIFNDFSEQEEGF